MLEHEILKSSSKSRSEEPVAGNRSLTIRNLGTLNRISQKTKIPVAQLINMAVDILCNVFFSNDFHSQAYVQIQQKAGEFPDDTIEFDLMRIGIEVIALLLQAETPDEKSLYGKLITTVQLLNQNGKEMSLQRLIIQALDYSLSQSDFHTDLLNKG